MALIQLLDAVNASSRSELLPTLSVAYATSDGALSLSDVTQASTGTMVCSVQESQYTYNYLYTGKTVGTAPAGTLDSVVFLWTDDPAGIDVAHATGLVVDVATVDAELFLRLKQRLEMINPADSTIAVGATQITEPYLEERVDNAWLLAQIFG